MLLATTRRVFAACGRSAACDMLGLTLESGTSSLSPTRANI